MPTTVSNSAVSNNPDIPVATVVRSGSVYQQIVQGIANQPHDEIVISYTGTNISQVVYKLSTVTVATITLTYTNDLVTSVVRT